MGFYLDRKDGLFHRQPGFEPIDNHRRTDSELIRLKLLTHGISLKNLPEIQARVKNGEVVDLKQYIPDKKRK